MPWKCQESCIRTQCFTKNVLDIVSTRLCFIHELWERVGMNSPHTNSHPQSPHFRFEKQIKTGQTWCFCTKKKIDWAEATAKAYKWRLWNTSTLLFPVSLLIGCWDWVQGGNPLYAAVKCLSGCWGQIWRNFSIFFAKRTWHTHFLTGKFFSETKNNFFPPKLAVFRGSRHFSKIEGPFSEIEGPGFERMWPLLLLSLINKTNNY